MPGRCRSRKAVARARRPRPARTSRVAGVTVAPAHVLADLRARVAVRREAVERRVVHPDPDREPLGREQRPGPRAARTTPPAPGSRSAAAAEPSGASRSLVQASAATITRPAVTWLAVLERERRPRHRRVVERRRPASGRAASRRPAAARRRWASLPRDGSAMPVSAWYSPTCSSSRRQAGQRRMISAASSRSNGTPSAVIASA